MRESTRDALEDQGAHWLNGALLGLHAEWLYYFAKLAEFGTIRRTARYLELTPQALSHVLTQLEKKTGCRLMKREGNRYVLTEAGQILLDQARLILQEFQAILQRVGELEAHPVRRQLSLGVTHAADFRLLAAALGRLCQDLPQCQPGVWHLLPVKARASLLNGEIELGLFASPLADPGLSSRLVALSPYTIVGTGSPASWQELEYIASPPHPELHRFSDDWPVSYPRRISAISGDLARAAIQLCLSGQGALYLPRRQVAAELAAGSLRELAEPPEPRQHASYLVWNGSRPLSQPAQVLLEHLPEIAPLPVTKQP